MSEWNWKTRDQFDSDLFLSLSLSCDISPTFIFVSCQTDVTDDIGNNGDDHSRHPKTQSSSSSMIMIITQSTMMIDLSNQPKHWMTDKIDWLTDLLYLLIGYRNNNNNNHEWWMVMMTADVCQKKKKISVVRLVGRWLFFSLSSKIFCLFFPM